MSAMTKRSMGTWVQAGAAAVFTIAGLGACMHVAHMFGGTGAEKPPAEAFGYGPRVSGAGAYRATLEVTEPLALRRMQTVRLRLADAEGRAVDGAEIDVDGGMPEHGHGLPTEPRVTRALGQGTYEIGGVRFNMGGWWEMTFAIAGPAGSDTVTFNLDL